MKKSMLLVLLLSPILLFPQNMSKENHQFKDTVDISELYTEDGKNMFSGNSIISEKTFCNGRMCVWWSVGNFDTLVYKALLNRELFTGIAENFENDTLVGRFTFIDGEMITSFTTYKDGSNYSFNNFKNMLRDGESLLYWDDKLTSKKSYKNGVAQGPYFEFEDWLDFGYGYLRVHGQYKDGKKDGLWVYSSSEEEWGLSMKYEVFNNLEQQGEVQWKEEYKDGEILNSNQPF
jgi:hypothetical protein